MASINDLLEFRAISGGDKLEWKRRSLKESHEAIVNADGTITTSDGKKHRTPSGAAKHLNQNKPVDGWIAWEHKKSGKRLSVLREEILTKIIIS